MPDPKQLWYPHIWVQPHDLCCDRTADQGCRAATSCSTEEGSTAGQLLGVEVNWDVTFDCDMEVSIEGGSPKWMVYKGKSH